MESSSILVSEIAGLVDNTKPRMRRCLSDKGVGKVMPLRLGGPVIDPWPSDIATEVELAESGRGRKRNMHVRREVDFAQRAVVTLPHRSICDVYLSSHRRKYGVAQQAYLLY